MMKRNSHFGMYGLEVASVVSCRCTDVFDGPTAVLAPGACLDFTSYSYFMKVVESKSNHGSFHCG